ncbi:MAG: Asp-tRNA(Asn)/Glu-tRNA(Gln) amidotransferase subunit GatC [Nitrospiraceae bacterium]|nr:MAG: Asp-tRNA(Asn)/Glu-tRNA(Gln) amidotransferase subunit GatC [Nitrospiraceae bacterium]
MEIGHVALLARLKLSDDEKELFSRQVGSILEYINKLDELDIKDIEPTAHVFPVKNVFREDRSRPSLPREKALQNAPECNENFYRVPKIIE